MWPFVWEILFFSLSLVPFVRAFFGCIWGSSFVSEWVKDLYNLLVSLSVKTPQRIHLWMYANARILWFFFYPSRFVLKPNQFSFFFFSLWVVRFLFFYFYFVRSRFVKMASGFINWSAATYMFQYSVLERALSKASKFHEVSILPQKFETFLFL